MWENKNKISPNLLLSHQMVFRKPSSLCPQWQELGSGSNFSPHKKGHFSHRTNYQPFFRRWHLTVIRKDLKIHLQEKLINWYRISAPVSSGGKVKYTLPHICHSDGRQLDDLLPRTFDSITARGEMQKPKTSGSAQTSGDQLSVTGPEIFSDYFQMFSHMLSSHISS